MEGSSDVPYLSDNPVYQETPLPLGPARLTLLFGGALRIVRYEVDTPLGVACHPPIRTDIKSAAGTRTSST